MLREVEMSLGLSRLWQWNYNDMTKRWQVSRRWIPEDPWVFFIFFFSIGPLLFSFFFSLSQQLSPTGTCWVFPSSLFICLVNSVIYHLRSVTELLLIAILRPPRCCFLDLIERRRRFLLSKGFGISLGSPKKPDGRITIRQIPTFIPCIFWFPY